MENSSYITEQQVITQHEAHHHEGPFYLSAEFWVAMSFVIVVILLFRPLFNLASTMIKNYIVDIKERIDGDAKVKEHAQHLLAVYEKKYKNADQEAKKLLHDAKKSIENMKQESLHKMQKDMNKKEQVVENRLLANSIKAEKEVKDLIIDTSIKAVKTAIENIMTKQQKAKLVDQSIENITKIKL